MQQRVGCPRERERARGVGERSPHYCEASVMHQYTHMHTMHIRKPSQRNAGNSKSTFEFTNSHFNNLQSK